MAAARRAAALDDEWIDPDAGKVTLGEYGRAWIEERPNLRPRTVELYGYLLRAHLVPHLQREGPERDQGPASPAVAEEAARCGSQ
ncbi:hypothetical protein [Planobispora rosea]|uniref:hypothetical protein n=1 Tax=Planobispora rosea TaxID=35762 RepID=UPI00114CDF3B|nr:hypothetical protein [Planobispora rosea]